MSKIVILGSGAAPGVPSLAVGWGACDPNNPKNRRRRTSTYVEIDGVTFLIDTSPDIHWHIFASPETANDIKSRFPYLVCDKEHPNDPNYQPSLVLNEVEHSKPFYVNGVKIVPIKLEGHPLLSNGYVFNDGELVYIADCNEISQESLRLIEKNPKLMVMPLTVIKSNWIKPYHMGLEKLLEYVNIIRPCKTIINHMASECDYDNVNNLTPENVYPAYDNMVVEF